jgi:hypothetical protein
MSLVVKLEKCRGVGVVFLQMEIVNLGLWSCVTTIFAYVHLRSALFVVVLVSHAVNFQAVTLQ